MVRRTVGTTAGQIVRSAGLVGLAVLVAALVASAQDRPTRSDAKLPSDLAAVPEDTIAFISCRVAELWSDPALEAAKVRLMKEHPEVLKELVANIGIEPAQVERVTFFLRAIGPNVEPVAIVRTLSPFDRKSTVAKLGAGSHEEKRNGHTLYTDARALKGLYLKDDRTFAQGPLGEIQSLLDQGKSAAGPLGPTLRLAASKHQVVVGFNLGPAKESLGAEFSLLPEPFKPLLDSRVSSITFDATESLRAELKMSYADEPSAIKGKEALKGAADMARTALLVASNSPTGRRLGAAGAGLAKSLCAGLESVTLEARGTEVNAKLTVHAGLKELSETLLTATTQAHQSARRVQSVNNLKQIALAMHNYHDGNASFPPAAIYDKDGQPLLSWRVLILPLVEQNDLFKEFHLDEPWNSEHNKKLLPRMPRVYQTESDGREVGETFCRGFHGKSAFFEGRRGIKISDFTDGLSNTFMVVEAATSVPWTKPDELSFDAAKPLPKVGFRTDGFYAALGDGSVRFIPRSTSEEQLKALITRNGGETIKIDR